MILKYVNGNSPVLFLLSICNEVGYIYIEVSKVFFFLAREGVVYCAKIHTFEQLNSVNFLNFLPIMIALSNDL